MHLIAAYDLREDEKGNIDNSSDGSCPSYAGKYYSANSGAAIWVHVNTPDDLSAVKNTLQSQLDKAFKLTVNVVGDTDEVTAALNDMTDVYKRQATAWLSATDSLSASGRSEI